MMLRVNNVRIAYPVGDVLDLGVKEVLIRALKREKTEHEFVAVDNVSFVLEQGDMLGIIGSNGAGKSTLAKAIANVVKPSQGSIWRGGKVTALLELSAGFDPDLTLRENTYLRAALMGYSKQFIDDMYGEIITFAELEAFQDRPFKQMSSGMKSRLAFAIACLIEPEILILDEVLSVGDGAFRRKSGDKMQEILEKGVTGILVSHSINQVRNMCNKILWLDHGRQIGFSDDVTAYCDAYESFLQTKKLPESEEEILATAEEWQLQKAQRQAQKAKKAQQRVSAIATQRQEAGLTQGQLARRTGYTQVEISYWERFKAVPTEEQLEKMARVLGCSVDALCQPENEEERSPLKSEIENQCAQSNLQ